MSKDGEELTLRLDASRWGGTHWQIFTSTSLGFLVWGLESVLGVAGYFLFNRSLPYLIVWYALDFIGDLTIPRLSDTRLARKGAFYLTMSLMGAGLLTVAAAMALYTYGLLSALPAMIVGLIGGGIAKIGIEGDVPVSLSFLAENVPASYREEALVLAPNFANIGGAVGAIIGYVTYSLTTSAAYEAIAVAAATLAALTVLAIVRSIMPESVRWLLIKGFRDRATSEASRLTVGEGETPKIVEPTIGIWGRYAFLTLISISQYLTFGLMAYTIAYFYYGSSAVYLLIIFFGNLGASVAAFPAYLLAKKLDTRTFTALSYIGGLATMVPILVYVLYFPNYLILFYALLFINMIFSEFGWAVRTILEPQLFPTERRATMVGLVRAWPMLAYDISVALTSTFTEVQTVLFNVGLWALGALASAFWLEKGYDVRRALLESVSSPRPRPGGALRAPAAMASSVKAES